MSNVLQFQHPPDYDLFNSKFISIFTRNGGKFHRIPVDYITYVGVKEPKENNEWEVTFLSVDGKSVTATTTASDAILLLIKLVREHGHSVKSNIA